MFQPVDFDQCSQIPFRCPSRKRSRQRPYCVECTGSHLNSEVNRRKARIVLRWVTAREVLRVLLAFSIEVFHSTRPEVLLQMMPGQDVQSFFPKNSRQIQFDIRFIMADIQSVNWLDIGLFFSKFFATNKDRYFA